MVQHQEIFKSMFFKLFYIDPWGPWGPLGAPGPPPWMQLVTYCSCFLGGQIGFFKKVIFVSNSYNLLYKKPENHNGTRSHSTTARREPQMKPLI